MPAADGLSPRPPTTPPPHMRDPETTSMHGAVRLPPIERPIKADLSNDRVSHSHRPAGGHQATPSLPSVSPRRASPKTVLFKENSALSLTHSGDIDVGAKDQHPEKAKASGHKVLASEVYRTSIRKPAPSDSGLVRCTVRRNKPLLGACTVKLFLDDGDVPLLAAKKSKSAFLICGDAEGLNKDAERSCLAKVSSRPLLPAEE